MFDFQKLDVYQRAKTVNLAIIELLENSKFSRTVHDQLSSELTHRSLVQVLR